MANRLALRAAPPPHDLRNASPVPSAPAAIRGAFMPLRPFAGRSRPRFRHLHSPSFHPLCYTLLNTTIRRSWTGRQAAVSTPSSRPRPSERESLVRRAELIISGVLRGGVVLSAAIILLGVVLYYLRNPRANPAIAQPEPFPHSLTAVLTGVAHANGLAVIALGLLILLATPVIRVAVSILAFALAGDRLYVAITALVLLILVVSFIAGRGGG